MPTCGGSHRFPGNSFPSYRKNLRSPISAQTVLSARTESSKNLIEQPDCVENSVWPCVQLKTSVTVQRPNPVNPPKSGQVSSPAGFTHQRGKTLKRFSILSLGFVLLCWPALSFASPKADLPPPADLRFYPAREGIYLIWSPPASPAIQGYNLYIKKPGSKHFGRVSDKPVQETS